MIRTVTLNPAIDKTIQVPNFTLDAVNRVTELRADAGGKGINVSKVVKELGGQSVAYAILAGDAGRTIKSMVEAMGIEVKAVEVEGETRTNTKIVDQALHTNTDVNEPGPATTEADFKALLDILVADIEEGDTVILAGSNKVVIDQSFQLIKEIGGRVLFFAAGYPAPETTLNANMIHYRRIELIGTMGGNAEDFATAAMLLNTRAIDVRPMCEPETFQLDQIQEAFEAASTPGMYRVHVEITEE